MFASDSQLQVDVMAELQWEPGVDHEAIGVAVNKGVVTLSGIVGSYSQKLLAEAAARRVKGVRAIAEDLIIRYPEQAKTTDSEIAQRVADIIDWNPLIPSEKVKVTVDGGVVTLRGEVPWHYQRDLAFKETSKISGVLRVVNLLSISEGASPVAVAEKIREAFERQADLDAKRIRVRTEGHKVILEGSVSRWSERGIAERAAWAAPGVRQIEDHLVIA